MCCDVFFFNDTATTEIYTLSLHDALPIYSRKKLSVTSTEPSSATRPTSLRPRSSSIRCSARSLGSARRSSASARSSAPVARSEEHTSELQSRQYLVCRLLLEKKKYEFIVV